MSLAKGVPKMEFECLLKTGILKSVTREKKT